MRVRRVLLTTSTLPRFPGDPEPRFVLDLAHALSERYEVTVLAPADAAASPLERDGRVTIRRYRYAPLRRMERLAYPGGILPRLRHRPWLWTTVPMLFLGLYAALRRLRLETFDLVHCHWLVPQGVVQATGFSGGRMPPFIVTSHGGDLTGCRGPLMRRLFHMVITRAGATTLVSEALRAEAGGVLARAPVIPMGVDLVRFHPRFAVSACFSQWCGDRPVLLFVGRLVEKKGLSVLLRALTEPALKATGAHLVVVGDGPLRPRLETCREALGLHDRVHFLPPAGHGRLPALYASADVFCAPSVVAANGETDGLPAVILEASACATPSVSTPVGGITELIEDGVNGLLVPPGDHVALARAAARLINDDALRNRLGRAARDRVAAYGWSRIAARFDLLYRSVLAADEAAGER